MSDEDVNCYTTRYGDVSGDARAHFLNKGEELGRNPNCA